MARNVINRVRALAEALRDGWQLLNNIAGRYNSSFMRNRDFPIIYIFCRYVTTCMSGNLSHTTTAVHSTSNILESMLLPNCKHRENKEYKRFVSCLWWLPRCNRCSVMLCGKGFSMYHEFTDLLPEKKNGVCWTSLHFFSPFFPQNPLFPFFSLCYEKKGFRE